jgi:hypothetical protein
MFRAAAATALLATAVACAGGPGPGGFGPSGVALSYAAEEPLQAAYRFSDTTRFSIEAGPMGTMVVLSAQAGTAEVALAGEEDGGVNATVGVPAYGGRFENPNQGTLRVDAGDIRGRWVLRLDPRGRVEVADSPALTAAARQIAGTESLVRPLFVHLPGNVAPFGTTWVDTVYVTETAAGTVSRARSIIRSTLVGDSMVGGRRLAVIRTESGTDLEVEGTSGGVEILQRMRGTILGTVLWDPALSILVERIEGGELEGTLELPGMGFAAMPVTAAVRRSVTLRP